MTRGEEREAHDSHALRFLNVGHGVRFRFLVIINGFLEFKV